jgi:nucleoside-diphosphate-sugar epimerase
MQRLEGEKILVTGVAGQIAFPLAASLAKHNEVWGIARFSDPKGRARVEAAGIRTRAIDLVDPQWGDLPSDFTLLLHLAAAIEPGHDWDRAIAINGVGTGQLIGRHRKLRACLSMSTCGVYASPADGSHAILEGDPLGGSNQPYSPTYCISKICQEAVTRYAAREFGIPSIIARMNVAYGNNGGLPSMYLDQILAGQPIQLFAGHSICSPIHEDDIYAHTPGLIASASVPATIVNWGGDEGVEVRELCTYMAGLVGREVRFETSEQGIHQYRLDPAKRKRLAGPCVMPWRDGIRRMIAARHPELTLR